MKQLAQEILPVDAFSKQIATDISSYLDNLREKYWFHRDKINSIPMKGDPTADYYFLGHNQMPAELRNFLFALAPTIDGMKPIEACVNRYEIGRGMPEHIDQAYYRYNMVIPLSDYGDGLLVGDQFFVDKPGSGLILPSRSPAHEVPPVKTKRYVLIYLYD